MEIKRIELPDYKGYENYIRELSNGLINYYCGYAVLPENHVLYDAESEFDERIINIDVHGGVIYMKNHIIGFDCNHLNDDINICNENYVITEIHKMIDQLIEM